MAGCALGMDNVIIAFYDLLLQAINFTKKNNTFACTHFLIL
jgi:hypothetical protein